jgi:hypothetical protein
VEVVALGFANIPPPHSLSQVYEVTERVYYRNCTQLATYRGRIVVQGLNDSARVRAYLPPQRPYPTHRSSKSSCRPAAHRRTAPLKPPFACILLPASWSPSTPAPQSPHPPNLLRSAPRAAPRRAAQVCTAFLNRSGGCEEYFNATCACPHVRRCFAPLLEGRRVPLLSYRLAPDPAGSALVTPPPRFQVPPPLSARSLTAIPSLAPRRRLLGPLTGEESESVKVGFVTRRQIYLNVGITTPRSRAHPPTQRVGIFTALSAPLPSVPRLVMSAHPYPPGI